MVTQGAEEWEEREVNPNPRRTPATIIQHDQESGKNSLQSPYYSTNMPAFLLLRKVLPFVLPGKGQRKKESGILYPC